MPIKKYISAEEALLKLQSYCAFQERCHEEVRSKLLSLNIYGETLESIIVQLIEDDFLNELRYSKAFAGGKFRIKKWGKQKIIRALKQKKISDYCINKAIQSEIPTSDYLETLSLIIDKKRITLKEKDAFVVYKKLVNFAMNKGYEFDVIKKIMNSQ